MSVPFLARRLFDHAFAPVHQHYQVFDFTPGHRDVGEGSGIVVHRDIETRAFWHDHRRWGELA